MTYLDEVIAVLQVDHDGHIQVLVARGERQGAPRHAVAHPRVLCQGFAQVTPGLWMLTPGGERETHRETLTQRDHQGAADTRTSNQWSPTFFFSFSCRTQIVSLKYNSINKNNKNTFKHNIKSLFFLFI